MFYFLLTNAYTFSLKKKIMIDIVTLAALYSQRADDLVQRSPGDALRGQVDLVGAHVLHSEPIGRPAENTG